MNNKSSIITVFIVSFLLITQTAHADFRKALDPYQNRDGTTMLKEVKDAVDKKNDDDGLILLLMATNMDAATSDYDEITKQSKSTLRAILAQPKWDEMRELLVQLTTVRWMRSIISLQLVSLEQIQLQKLLMSMLLKAVDWQSILLTSILVNHFYQQE